MSVVVESGTARCPRCMAHAVYRFVEDPRAQAELRYEVSCTPCGNVYTEDCSAPVIGASAA